MNPFVLLLAILCTACMAAGQLLFKLAALRLPAHPAWADWACNPWLLAALAVYGATTLLWVWVLRQAPLSVVYPVMALAFVLVPVLAWLLLGESLAWQTLAGSALILAGISLTAMGRHG